MYDAIVVGARCAGASLAMLLARKGYRVLLADRATFPSDHTMSTHLVWQNGTNRLRKGSYTESNKGAWLGALRSGHLVLSLGVA